MIDEIKKIIAYKLKVLHPTYTVYDEDIPQGFSTPSFLISLVDHAYSKMLHEKSNSLLSFDIAYFTNSKQINNDIQLMQVELLRSFDLVTRGDFKIRILNKRCSTTDNVLHFLFDVNHCEISTETFVKMQKGITHTNMKEA